MGMSNEFPMAIMARLSYVPVLLSLCLCACRNAANHSEIPNASAGADSSISAPDEEKLGKSLGYPLGTKSNWFYDESVRVGSFSNLDKINPYRLLAKPTAPSPLEKAAVEPPLRYTFEGGTYTIDDFLSRQRITGLLIVKDGRILVERYQYGRLPTHRFVSNSIAKSITSLALAFALQDGSIRSLDDKVSKYVPELKGYAYGEVEIRHALRMSSGIKLSEAYNGNDDLQRFADVWKTKSMIDALRMFSERDAEEGKSFHYDSAQAFLIGLAIRGATGKSLSDYLDEKLWKPMGAEADATWIIDQQGVEACAGNFNAVLRDYGRLGMLLANDGMSNGKQVIPKDYLLEATDWHRHPDAFAPGAATPLFGYGYLFWLFPGERRQFAMMGAYGQIVFVDPELKLVLVHTGAARNAFFFEGDPMGPESLALWSSLTEIFKNGEAVKTTAALR
jgi:CubicO group peptidase (beta-lactamase class C family)